jgi:hypothetical protein
MFAIAACFARDFAGNQAAVKALEESSQLASESKEELVIVMVQLNPDAPPIERDLESQRSTSCAVNRDKIKGSAA